MSIATPALTNFTAGELSPRLEGRVDLSKYFNGCRRLENFHVHPHGGATRRSGFRFVAEAMNPERPSLLIPFEFNADQTYILEFGENAEGKGRMRVFTDRGLVLRDGQPYERDIPYCSGEFDRLGFAQSADTLILVHPHHPPRTLVRHDHNDWSLEDMAFTGKPECWTGENQPSAVCFHEQRLVLAATPDRPGTIWFSRTGDIRDFRLKTREVPLSGWRDKEIRDANNDGARDGRQNDNFTLYNGEGFERRDALKGQNPDGETRYYRYKGEVNLVAEGADIVVTFKDAPGKNQIESVHLADDTLNADFWESFAVGDRTDAVPGDDPLDDDAIEVTLCGRQANAIEFLVPKSKLWIGTAGGEWTVGSGTGGVITPRDVKASREGTSGAAQARPEAVGYATLFIQRAGRKIREMTYRFEADSYVSKDLTVLAEHVTESGVVCMAYAREPDSVLYCVRNDGTLAALTYMPDQEVAAWSRIITRGHVDYAACIYSRETRRDELWIVVRRKLGTRTVRCVEVLEDVFHGDVTHGFFVDSGLSYSGPPATKITGLDHLAGETVHVLADGATHPPVTVSAEGTVTLTRAARVIHAGLPYVSLLQPMRLEAGSMRGTAQTKRKRIIKVSLRFHDTLGGRAGPSPHRLEPVHFRSSADPMGMSPGAWSGDKSVAFPQGWNRDGLLTVVQDQPLPMTVLMIVPELVINE